MRWLVGRLKAHRWRRTWVILIPLLFALLHVRGALHLQVLERLDHIIYDTRLRATMPRTLDERFVIVDIDEKSLEEVGHWPWGRDKLAALARELLDRQQVDVLGFDVVFAERDDSSGLASLQQLAQGPLRGQPLFQQQLRDIAPTLDFDAQFARALAGRPVVLGYYFTSDRDGGARGSVPAPVLAPQDLRGLRLPATVWTGHGGNLPGLAQAVPLAGFFNPVTDADGVVRSLPLLAEYQGQYYESLSLAMFRASLGLPRVLPGYAHAAKPAGRYDPLHSVVLQQGEHRLALPVDDQLAVLIPYRGRGGADGGSFQYVSASDVLRGRLAPGALAHKMVLLGSTAPGLQDLRVTPAGRAYPGVEMHASLLSALLDGHYTVQPDYADDYDLLQLLVAGVLLALVLPMLGAGHAVVFSMAVVAALASLNLWLFRQQGLALPLATVVVMAVVTFALNMVYGYFGESRSKRALARLFRTYVPPELVDEMVKQPERYTMEARNQELTVLFCDMRGFTAMSERMEPLALQALLNQIFSRLTHVIQTHRGTIDKYMGDCVMAFWGAPVPTPDHAHLAVQAALGMAQAVQAINDEHRSQGLPEIGVGIGINTGTMCVGDMGSNVRLAYTVIGDAVNLGSRLEGLTKTYGVPTIASDTTQAQAAAHYTWQELDRVRVKGKAQAVGIYWPVGLAQDCAPAVQEEMRTWQQFLTAYRAQHWAQCHQALAALAAMPSVHPDRTLYTLYAQRVRERELAPPQPDWDGTTQFDTK